MKDHELNKLNSLIKQLFDDNSTLRDRVKFLEDDHKKRVSVYQIQYKSLKERLDFVINNPSIAKRGEIYSFYKIEEVTLVEKEKAGVKYYEYHYKVKHKSDYRLTTIMPEDQIKEIMKKRPDS